MIYVTGDTHGDCERLTLFAEQNPQLNRDDYMIVAGDFGAVWAPERLDIMLQPFKELPYTVLFVDGNHENFDMLDAYPIRRWNGGNVHKIADNIIHLMRGQIYEIDGKLFFTFGGATSAAHDKADRVEGKDWWERESPSDMEFLQAQRNLDKACYMVDYIITHACDENALFYPPLTGRTLHLGLYPENFLLNFFDQNVTYRHWYFGHYHIDGDVSDKKTAVYRNIIRI